MEPNESLSLFRCSAQSEVAATMGPSKNLGTEPVPEASRRLTLSAGAVLRKKRA